MAAAVLKNPIPEAGAGLGTLRVRAADVVLSATAYATGGISVPKSNIYLNEIYFAQVFDITNGPTGYIGVYNQATNKLQLFQDAAPVVASGRATLVAGTVTVANTAVQSAASGQQILLTNAVAGGTLGDLSVGTRTAGTSFVINSTSATDTSQVDWAIVNSVAPAVEVANATNITGTFRIVFYGV